MQHKGDNGMHTTPIINSIINDEKMLICYNKWDNDFLCAYHIHHWTHTKIVR